MLATYIRLYTFRVICVLTGFPGSLVQQSLSLIITHNLSGLLMSLRGLRGLSGIRELILN